MAVSFNCKCEERQKPAQERVWVVVDRYCNYSTFNGRRETPSDYSTVFCPTCRAIGRTKASYVAVLKDGDIT